MLLGSVMSSSAGRNGAKKVPASNNLTSCLANFLRHFFYRHGASPKALTAQKTSKTAVIKWT